MFVGSGEMIQSVNSCLRKYKNPVRDPQQLKKTPNMCTYNQRAYVHMSTHKILIKSSGFLLLLLFVAI